MGESMTSSEGFCGLFVLFFLAVVVVFVSVCKHRWRRLSLPFSFGVGVG